MNRPTLPGYQIVSLLLALAGCSARHDGSTTGSAGRTSFDNPNHGSSGDQTGTGPSAANGGHGSITSNSACSKPGATRICCGSGVETCEGTAEFMSWGPCLDHGGKTLSCPHSCADDEFGHCDAGTIYDGGARCGEGEFAIPCDAGTPPPPSLCTNRMINNEPEILAGYSPANGQSVTQDGEIKVWITDEAAAMISANEQIDPSTGLITTPGDRTATAKDGYLWEPALYIAPETAENGGTPHFPKYIRGWYNNVPSNAPPKPGKNAGTSGAAIETPPAGIRLSERFNSEDVWEVSDLGLAPGTYQAEFVIHDGDTDRGVGCVTITVEP